MKTFKIVVLCAGFFIALSCSKVLAQETVKCDNFSCLQQHQNQKAIIEGKLVAFEPTKTGKGKGYMYWDLQLDLKDGNSVPVKKAEASHINLRLYQDKNVRVHGWIFYGIIIGSAEGQFVRGYRLDVDYLEIQP